MDIFDSPKRLFFCCALISTIVTFSRGVVLGDGKAVEEMDAMTFVNATFADDLAAIVLKSAQARSAIILEASLVCLGYADDYRA